jgi:hypothetical protein
MCLPLLAIPQLLSQIFVVSRISAVKIKLLAKVVMQQARGESIDQNKIPKLLGDGKFETHEVKGVVAALHFILQSSARYNVEEEALALELQQLGLPKEHTEALVGALRDGRAALQQHLADASLRLGKLEALRWRVHEDAGSARAHSVQLHLGVLEQPHQGGPGDASAPALRSLDFRVDADTLALLQAELRAAKEAVEAISPAQ